MSSSALNKSSSSPRVAILGGGIIGLTIAREMADCGAHVKVIDKQHPGRGASWAAAGMLAPAYEGASEPGGHPRLFEFCMQSASMWPQFAAELQAMCGYDIGYRSGPSFATASTAEEVSRLDAIGCQLKAYGLPSEKLSGDELRTIEPSLSRSVERGLLLASDGHVDNRKVISALLGICDASSNIQVVTDTEINDLSELKAEFDAVICAAGWQTSKLTSAAVSIQPIAGQMLSVAALPGSPVHAIRSGATYMVPKDGQIVIGATMEYGAVRSDTDTGDISMLKRTASTVCPVLAEAETLNTWSGVRPGTPDNAPLIGWSGEDNVYVAAGHYRNGVLLAPATAKIMTNMVLDGVVSDLGAAFSPNRFVEAAV